MSKGGERARGVPYSYLEVNRICDNLSCDGLMVGSENFVETNHFCTKQIRHSRSSPSSDYFGIMYTS